MESQRVRHDWAHGTILSIELSWVLWVVLADYWPCVIHQIHCQPGKVWMAWEYSGLEDILQARVWRGGSLVELSPLSLYDVINSKQLLSELNCIVRHSFDERELNQKVTINQLKLMYIYIILQQNQNTFFASAHGTKRDVSYPRSQNKR